MGIIVNSQEYQSRLATCRGCKHYTSIGSCGPLAQKTKVKETIKNKKVTAELCGCLMAVKCKLKFARCPIMKWSPADATKEDLGFMKRATKFVKSIEGKASLSAQEVQELFSFHNETHSSKKKSSGCAPCVKGAVNDLSKWVEDYK